MDQCQLPSMVRHKILAVLFRWRWLSSACWPTAALILCRLSRHARPQGLYHIFIHTSSDAVSGLAVWASNTREVHPYPQLFIALPWWV
jgi:hypothetical protein